MPTPLKFYDLKNKKSFTTDEYQLVQKGSRQFAVADSPDGQKCWKVHGSKLK